MTAIHAALLDRMRLLKGRNLKRIASRESLCAGLVLFVLLNVCFFPCIWGKRTLLESAQSVPSILPDGAWAGKKAKIRLTRVLDPGAPGWFSEPLLELIHSEYLKEKSIPLWNPYQAYGAPLAANMQSQSFYPLTVALSLHPTPRTYSWYILLRLFVAGICAYLYLRLFVSFLAALAGGVSSMLAGYYLLYSTMPHLSVDVLLPAGLLAGEYFLRKQSYRSVIWFAVVLLLMMVGGMPESILIILSFVYIYVIFRLVSDGTLRAVYSRILTRLVAATAAGVSLSAFLLLPFVEYLRGSFNDHDPSQLTGTLLGVLHDPLESFIFTYLCPLVFGAPLRNGDWSGIRNYFGLISVFLVFISISGLLRRRGKSKSVSNSLTIFFLVTAITVILKRFGFPVVNMIGMLPLYRVVSFTKYEEVILSISVSVLCALGLERLIKREVSVSRQVTALGITFLLLPLLVVCSRTALKKQLASGLAMPLWALGLPVCLLFAISISLILYNSKEPDTFLRRAFNGSWFPVLILVLLGAEMSLNYIVPMYYVFNELPFRSNNPYVGAPFIRAIQSDSQEGEYRIVARGGVLFPDWASAFNLFDIRDLDALYEQKYFSFLREFLPVHKKLSVGEDLDDRFTGLGTYDFNSPSERRLLQLSSVKYIATTTSYTIPNRTVDEILKQDQGHLIRGRENLISRQQFDLGGEAREALGEHPPYERLPYRVKVGNHRHEVWHFAIGMNPAVFGPQFGDGVEFIVEVRDGAGRITKLFSKYIDPKHNVGERRWVDGEVDLSQYRGEWIDLLLSTTPGPRGDSAWDWAAWSKFHFDGEPSGAAVPFQEIYNKEAKVYRYDDVVPRAAVYYHAELRNSEGEVLRTLADPSFDVFQSVAVEAPRLNPRQRAALAAVNQSALRRETPARISSYRSQAVTMDVSADRSAIVVLNDSDYPGWTVDVDGRRDEWFPVNYMFRGVVVPAGRHTVRFVYRPKSFYAGLSITGTALLVLVIVGFIRSQKRDFVPPSAVSEVSMLSSEQ